MDKEKERWIEDLLTSVNECRVLVFIEARPQSNKYCQIVFDAEQFNKLSFAIQRVCQSGSELTGLVDIQTSSEEYLLPDLQSFVDKKK